MRDWREFGTPDKGSVVIAQKNQRTFCKFRDSKDVIRTVSLSSIEDELKKTKRILESGNLYALINSNLQHPPPPRRGGTPRTSDCFLQGFSFGLPEDFQGQDCAFVNQLHTQNRLRNSSRKCH